jgi:hypothetical protein
MTSEDSAEESNAESDENTYEVESEPILDGQRVALSEGSEDSDGGDEDTD